MPASKVTLEFERMLYRLTRVYGETIEYYVIGSSTPDFKTGEQSQTVQTGRCRFALTTAIISERQLLGRLDLQIADQYFLCMNRDTDFEPHVDSYIGWNSQFWKIVRVQTLHGGRLLACKTHQGLVVNE